MSKTALKPLDSPESPKWSLSSSITQSKASRLTELLWDRRKSSKDFSLALSWKSYFCSGEPCPGWPPEKDVGWEHLPQTSSTSSLWETFLHCGRVLFSPPTQTWKQVRLSLPSSPFHVDKHPGPVQQRVSLCIHEEAESSGSSPHLALFILAALLDLSGPLPLL